MESLDPISAANDLTCPHYEAKFPRSELDNSRICPVLDQEVLFRMIRLAAGC